MLRTLGEIKKKLSDELRISEYADAWTLEAAQRREAKSEIKKIRYSHEARDRFRVEFLMEYFGITEKDLEE